MEEQDSLQIDFKVLWQVLYQKKFWIIGITLLFGIIGVIYAFSLREEFTAEGKILPESQSKNGGGQYMGLASLAGVDIGSMPGGLDAVRPDLYPDVLKTTPYFLEILRKTFKDKNGKSTNLEKLLLDKDANDVPAKDLKLLYAKSPEYIVYNKLTGSLIKNLKTRITALYDKKTGVIGITVKLPDPVIAAELTNFSMNYLTNYIINYRVEKQKQDLDFISNRLANAKGKYYANQEKKASYSDQLPLEALRMQTADLQRERIESEYRMSSGFYNSLLQKYEEAKLKIQQETPVIKVLEPAVAPNLKSEPKKANIILIFLILGGIISIAFLLIKNYKQIFL